LQWQFERNGSPPFSSAILIIILIYTGKLKRELCKTINVEN
jgi:hypothetical protein